MPKTVLVVEDDEFMQEVIEYALKSGDVRVLQASKAHIALRTFHEHRGELDGILMDACLELKEPDTLSLSGYFREMDFSGPIIAMSSLEEHRKKQLASGCTHEAPKEKAAEMILQLLGE